MKNICDFIPKGAKIVTSESKPPRAFKELGKTNKDAVNFINSDAHC